MTGDVQEVETSVISSLDLMFKNPILILSYFTTLMIISWQLTLFSVAIIPLIGWFMGWVGRKLKAKSILAQSLWSDTMSVVDETLGGLRIIKAFCAEDKMREKFNTINSSYRNHVMRVNIRQNCDDCHRIMVRRCPRLEPPITVWSHLYILYGDPLFDYQPPERGV